MKINSVKLLLSCLIILSGFLSSKACDTCTVKVATVNYTTISFEGVLYDFPVIGQSTWFYNINNLDIRGGGISHFNFGVGECLTPDMLIGGGTYTGKTLADLKFSKDFDIGFDGSDQNNMYGIKYDKDILQGTTTQLFFVLNTNLLVSANLFKIKIGNLFYQGIICLPSIHCVPLPVELLNFGVSLSNGYPHLRWATASELNNNGFEIQHSLDAIEFSNIGFVESHHNSNVIQHYMFTDFMHQEGYYRLKMIDYDLHFEYSEIVHLDKNINVMIAPNPAMNEFVVTLGSNHITDIKLIDRIGQDITSSVKITKFEEHSSIDISNLPEGFYSIILNNKNHGCFIHL